MPLTPFHFGPSALVAFVFNRKLDFPVFVLANVVIDMEPLIVLVFNLSYPLHGYAHSFLGAIVAGSLWGLLAFRAKDITAFLMKIIGLPYYTGIGKCICSGIAGALFHVLLDAPLYADMKPFYPLRANPFYGIITGHLEYVLCVLSFIPAIILYIIAVKKTQKTCKQIAPDPVPEIYSGGM